MGMPSETFPIRPDTGALLGAVADALGHVLATEPASSPLRYPVRVATEYVRMALGLQAPPTDFTRPLPNPPPLGEGIKTEPPWGEGTTAEPSPVADERFAAFDPESACSPSFARVHALVGPERAMLLVMAFGGTRLYIPAPGRMGPMHALVQLLGAQAADVLARVYGGQSVKVPTGHFALLRYRNAHICERHAAGETAAALARENGIAEDSVYRILARASVRLAERCKTLDLFEGLLPERMLRQWERERREGAGHE